MILSKKLNKEVNMHNKNKLKKFKELKRLGKKPFKIQKKEKIMIRILIITLRKFLIII